MAACSRSVAVRPCVRSTPATGGAIPWFRVGRPAVLDPVGWGTPPPTSPRAADRSGRRTPPPGPYVATGPRRPCTERAHACSPNSDLAENSPIVLPSISVPTTALDGARGIAGSASGGAFRSRRPCPVRPFAIGAAGARARAPCARGGSASPPARLLRGSMVTGSYGAPGCPRSVEASMRWLVGWSSAAAGADRIGSAGATGYDGETVQPVGSQLLWGDPDPLWAVGDWRPDEIRVVQSDAQTRIAVLGTCGASDEQLRVSLFAARGGALRHLTAWPGSYTAVVQVGRRITVCGDLAGARPVFHTPWAGGTAYATAALPLADLVEANLDFAHLAALLAAPDVPAALHDSTPYEGVRRIPPGHALILRAGAREVAGYEPVASLAVAAPPADPDSAVDAVRDALVEAVRARLSAPRHVPDIDPGPVPGMGPAERRAARGMPVPGIGADLSGGPASGTLALLAAGLPGNPGTLLGHGTGAGERLLAVTFNDLAVGGREAELERAGALAANPRLHHVVVTGGEDVLPYADPGRPAHRRARTVPWSWRPGTAPGWPRAARTTSPDTAPARCSTPIPRAWPTS
ncbi:conserved hypothetical protein [Streptomyces sp. e14]|nr:conserved hypothetical protein [Streptomyces sp. e14]